MMKTEVISSLKKALCAAWSAARILCVRSICESEFVVKRNTLQEACIMIEFAALTDAVLRRHFRTKVSGHGWKDPSIFAVCHKDDALWRKLSMNAFAECAGAISRLVNLAQDGLFSHIRPLLAFAKAVCEVCGPSRTAEQIEFGVCEQNQTIAQTRVKGPRILGLPAAFIKDASIMEKDQPIFSDEFVNVVEYLWHRAAREAAASALCALNAFECDNAPLDYYCDTVRQAFDEARHAEFYWTQATEAFDRVAADDSLKDSEVYKQIQEFRKTGKGLKLPAEGVFFDSYWNSDFIERLCLMNIDTEAAGLAKFEARIKWARENGLDRLSLGLQVDQNDERYHARIGAVWLKRLIPDNDERKNALRDARSKRGLLIMSAVAPNQGSTLIKYLRGYFRDDS